MVDSNVSDTPTASDAPICTRQSSFCNGGSLYECVNGRGQILESCALGCLMTNTARCGTLRPSNYSGTTAWSGTVDVVVGSGELWVLNSSSQRIEQRSPNAPQTVNRNIEGALLGVEDDNNYVTFHVRSLRVEANGTLLVRGSKPVILLVAQAVTIEGRVLAGDSEFSIDDLHPAGAGVGGTPVDFGAGFLHGVSGGGGGGGGGGRQETSQAIGSPRASNDGGGGGGGFASAGGRGAATDESLRGAPGAANGIATLEPMSAGSGGGSGADDSTGPGGDGGGALQISAQMMISIASNGVVDSGGAGGANGERGNANNGAGSGGGSGGAILLEAPLVDVRGHVSVMGGGGGGAASADGVNAGTAGSAGESGRWTANLDNAGANGGMGGGGRGSRVDDGQASQGAGTNGSPNGGGGGGGAGRIRINSIHGSRVLNISDRFLPRPQSGFVTAGTPMGQ